LPKNSSLGFDAPLALRIITADLVARNSVSGSTAPTGAAPQSKRCVAEKSSLLPSARHPFSPR